MYVGKQKYKIPPKIGETSEETRESRNNNRSANNNDGITNTTSNSVPSGRQHLLQQHRHRTSPLPDRCLPLNLVVELRLRPSLVSGLGGRRVAGAAAESRVHFLREDVSNA